MQPETARARASLGMVPQKQHRPHTWAIQAQRFFWIALGAALVALGLDVFLVPNQIVDGGVVGISIMAAYLSGLPVGLFTFVLNLPFLWIGYKQIGRTFALSTLAAVGLMSLLVYVLHPVPVITEDLLLASVFGGVILGLGVGMIIRHGGSLDGTEIVAIMLTRRLPFSVGEIIMFFNIFILGSAGFIFNWDRAMYSLIAYFIAFKTIDIVIEGLDESKSALIVTGQGDAIRDAILQRLGRGVTEFMGRGGYTGEEKNVLYCVVSRLELSKLKEIVAEHDPHAFVTIENVHEVLGRFKKRPIH